MNVKIFTFLFTYLFTWKMAGDFKFEFEFKFRYEVEFEYLTLKFDIFCLFSIVKAISYKAAVLSTLITVVQTLLIV